MRTITVRSATISILSIFLIILFVHFSSQPTSELKSSLKPQFDHEDINAKQSLDEKFMSFFPHGDFATQHEAVRNALRIALETNRTLILPQVRLGKTWDWQPFAILSKYYESQDKQVLKTSCRLNQHNWMTNYQPCQQLNQWIELPWSTFFNLDVLRKDFSIRIIERTSDHNWGTRDTLTSFLKPEQVIVLDPTSFASNGSDWETKTKINRDQSFFSRFFSSTESASSQDEKDSLKLKTGLKNVIQSQDLTQISQRYIQFGSLVYGLRFLTNASQRQSALQRALRSNVFVSPNQFHAVNQVSQTIVNALGGAGTYNCMHMTIGDLVKTELLNQISMKRENAAIERIKFVDDTKFSDDHGQPYNTTQLLNQLTPNAQLDLMTALVRELNGDMPINQAVSVALPLKNSLLRDLLSNPYTKNRQSLLDACIDYRKAVDGRYPIYYLSNDIYKDIHQHLELFGPLVEAFPCMFTKNDMYILGLVDSDWAERIHGLNDLEVDYDDLLSIVVEILVARKGYSFFEVPTTKLTRLLSWN
ncbi:hypothetical protein EDC94DRAFT_606527 [Helicostylum pulchrum]|nr:hypothetical protein EDC94DRAFT_606527 [Helicostylum pulchrum]